MDYASETIKDLKEKVERLERYQVATLAELLQFKAENERLRIALYKIQGGELTSEHRQDREFLVIFVDTVRAYAREALEGQIDEETQK